jgi:hypothetical protein
MANPLLQAIADAFGLRINILTSYPNSAFIGISPTTEKSHRCLYLSFWAEVSKWVEVTCTLDY